MCAGTDGVKDLPFAHDPSSALKAFEIPPNELFPGEPSANVYAFDPTRGRVATMTHVWSLDDFSFVGLTLVSETVGSFFDRHGKLWSADSTLLLSQSFPAKP